MRHDDKSPPQSSAGSPRARARKPYVKPSFQGEQIFETMALSCGKVNSSQAQCKFNKKAS
jgi:hypothetical protein